MFWLGCRLCDEVVGDMSVMVSDGYLLTGARSSPTLVSLVCIDLLSSPANHRMLSWLSKTFSPAVERRLETCENLGLGTNFLSPGPEQLLKWRKSTNRDEMNVA